jgi:hypothetical protein
MGDEISSWCIDGFCRVEDVKMCKCEVEFFVREWNGGSYGTSLYIHLQSRPT